MKLILLLLSVLQDGAIEFPEGVRPPAPAIEETPQPAPVDTFRTDELYLIQSDLPLHLIPSPPGVVNVTPAKSGSVIFSRFAGGSELEERQVLRQHGYVLRGVKTGTIELLILPAGSQDLGELRRRTLTITGQQVRPDQQPDSVMPLDDVSVAFIAYERAWRKAQGELADRLERGEITSEKLAAEWFDAANREMRKTAFLPLLESETRVFRGDAWTPDGHAKYVRRYAGGK